MEEDPLPQVEATPSEETTPFPGTSATSIPSGSTVETAASEKQPSRTASPMEVSSETVTAPTGGDQPSPMEAEVTPALVSPSLKSLATASSVNGFDEGVHATSTPMMSDLSLIHI